MEVNASSTDAKPTVTKRGGGGFRLACNTQFSSGCDSQVIIGVDGASCGNDMGQLAPMSE
ncbi:hypothetical protein [Candidatus Nitrotoga sp. BS]|uniref:hypothetical protein n=1 Tax=Candidatus Nitrotoga sp. BS TaxID=2890408 RepID=UPI001EF2D7A2|nr:hypothetical protein [Candidatus Nitrotoga sp. BS]